MRLKDREITDKEALNQILKEGQLMHLALAVDNEPYVVCLNYGYDGDDIYFHCAKDGKKIDMIKKNSKVCFEILDTYKLIKADEACEYTAVYKSLVGTGTAKIIVDPEQKRYGLDIVMAQVEKGKIFRYPSAMIKRVGVVKISVDNITGKKSD